MRVAFDVTAALTARTGVPRFVIEVSRALEARGVTIRRYAISRRGAAPEGTRHIRLPNRLVHAMWDRTPWPRVEWLAGDADLFQSGGTMPPPSRRPVVATVYDLDPLDHPEYHGERARQHLAGVVRHLDRAAAIVTISQVTADALVARGAAPDRIVVVPLGVTAMPEAAPYPATRPFLLAVGELTPRKGLDLLLRALPRVPNVDLVLAGPSGHAEPMLRALAVQLELKDRVRFLGAVSDDELASLYRSAIALCYPTHAEGFGLPVLEAMAAGLPVVTSDLPVLREVAGDAARFFATGNTDALAEAVAEVVDDSALRDRLRDDGLARAARFTWDRAAEAHLDAYRLALG